MKTMWMLAVVALLLGCAPAMAPDMPIQVVGPENHALVLDGLS